MLQTLDINIYTCTLTREKAYVPYHSADQHIPSYHKQEASGLEREKYVW